MSERLHIHGAWWVREENIESATKQVNETFRRLGELAPNWRTWYLPHESIETLGQPETPVSNDLALVRQQLLLSQQRKAQFPISPDLGYSMIASSEPAGGGGLERCHLYVQCCSRTRYAGYNVVSMELAGEPSAPHLFSPDLLCRAVSILAEVWDADWISVRRLGMRLTPQPWPAGPVLGWINYLAERTGVVPRDLPIGWEWFQHRGERQVFAHAGCRPDEHNAEHAAAFKRMFDSIQWGRPPV